MGAATSTILLASSAISSRVVVGLVAASTMRTFMVDVEGTVLVERYCQQHLPDLQVAVA